MTEIRYRYRTIGPEHYGLTGPEYDALRALGEGAPESVRPEVWESVTATLEERGLILEAPPTEGPVLVSEGVGELTPAVWPHLVTEAGLEVLRGVGTFREPIAARRRFPLERRIDRLGRETGLGRRRIIIELATVAVLAVIIAALFIVSGGAPQ